MSEITSGTVPSCPVCGTPMRLRKAKRGRNADGQFWGCAQFPACKGTRDVDPNGSTAASASGAVSTKRKAHHGSLSLGSLPVSWGEAAVRREFVPEYVSVGAMPGVFRERLGYEDRVERVLSQCLLLWNRTRARESISQPVRLASALLRKILQRGRIPLPTLAVEREALRTYGFLSEAKDLSSGGLELGWELPPSLIALADSRSLIAASADRMPFILDPSFGFDPGSESAFLQSEAEACFLERWVPQALGQSAGHWFTPQASLDTLVESAGSEGSGSRRIDFLFHHPGAPPFAIEIDGPEHKSAADVDNARDALLKSVGIDVLRISNDEVLRGEGAVLDDVKTRCRAAFDAFRVSPERNPAVKLVTACSEAAKIQFAITRAMEFGWLPAGEAWEIHLPEAGTVAAAAVLDLLQMLIAVDALYGGDAAPDHCVVHADNGTSAAWARGDGGEWLEADYSSTDSASHLRIVIQSKVSPFHQGLPGDAPDFIIRPAFLPIEFAREQASELNRCAITPSSYEAARPGLTTFLRNVFRKLDFRPMQGESIYNTLRQRDSVVLLPTGAGKSLIYQLAGLLMPGVTLVVDPLNSLIEDQVEGMNAFGIDRAVPIASNLASNEERRRLLIRVERGEYHFVLHSPERMQSPQFRAALRALAEVSLINLAVIDEAHCVSEWGHDFRPAYLNLAENLRRHGQDRSQTPPPLLALTGTASRAVLRDMLIDLGIDRNDVDAVIRPESFDRTELAFEIARSAPPEDPKAKLRGILNALPGKFGYPRAEFFRKAGAQTASGIVFVPTVNARDFGLYDTRAAVQHATGTEVTIYSGGAPRGIDRTQWDNEKRGNARAFKQNDAPVLVATKAFGMGIDKPNVRYTVHFGMPSSLESFYQEAGRAGRDRKPARCLVLFSEFDSKRSDDLLDPGIDLKTLQVRFERANQNRQSGDDVTRALWFHLRAFGGSSNDVKEIHRVLDQFEDLSTAQVIEIPFGTNEERERRERAIYRLLRISVISDYEVDFGGRRFIVHVREFDLDRCRDSLLDYVHAAQPAKGAPLSRQLDAISSDDSREAALSLGTALVEFTYDVVERSRRRMIQEAVQLARQAQDDADIRSRLLDYLQEGLGASNVDQLLGSNEIDLSAWHELIQKPQTPVDAGELRGLCIRALESYPDHPGLLLARAVAESMCRDGDQVVCSQGILAAICSAFDDYEIPAEEIEPVIDSLFDLALTRAPNLALPLVISTLGIVEGLFGMPFPWAPTALRRSEELENVEVRAAIKAYRVRQLVERLEYATDLTERRYSGLAKGQKYQRRLK